MRVYVNIQNIRDANALTYERTVVYMQTEMFLHYTHTGGRALVPALKHSALLSPHIDTGAGPPLYRVLLPLDEGPRSLSIFTIHHLLLFLSSSFLSHFTRFL